MKRKSAFLLIVIGMVFAALVLPAALAPAPASAAIGSLVWLNTAYKGSDLLLGGTIQAYEAGSTATLLVSLQNTTGETIEIKGAKVEFDWAGGEYAATDNYPATLANNERGTVAISFTVPEASAISSRVRHSYTVFVDYAKAGGYGVGNPVARQNLGGVGTVWTLDSGPVDPSTLHVYVNGQLTTAYTLDCYYGMGGARITFATAPPLGASVNVDYQQVELVGAGNGAQTVFQLDHPPVVPGTQQVYVDCALSADYTLDPDAGTITFNAAPAAGKYIIANYQYAARWTAAGDDFAVYSADQNAAMAVKQKLVAIGTPTLNTTGSRELAAKSAMEEQLGDQQYAAGNLEEARTHYDQAYIFMDSALSGDKDPNSLKEVEPTGTLLLGIGMVLLAFGAIGYVLLMPRGGRR